MVVFSYKMANSKPKAGAKIATISDITTRVKHMDERYQVCRINCVRANRIKYLKGMITRTMCFFVAISVLFLVFCTAKMMPPDFIRSRMFLMPYYEDNAGNVNAENIWIRGDGSINNPNQLIKDKFDTSDDNYIKIQIKEFPNGRAGLFVHDFTSNITALVDAKAKRCFLLSMNRTLIVEPKNIQELLLNTFKGMYNLNQTVLKNNYRARPHPISERLMDILPTSIKEECIGYPTFLLRVARNVKRSYPDHMIQNKYFVVSGEKIHQILISNFKYISSIP